MERLEKCPRMRKHFTGIEPINLELRFHSYHA